MFCENCGKEIKDNDVFCPNCGKLIQEEKASNSSDVKNRSDIDKPKKKKSNSSGGNHSGYYSSNYSCNENVRRKL